MSVASSALRDVTDEEVAAFWRDGVVCLRGILPQTCLDRLEVGVERYLNSETRFSLSDMGVELGVASRKPKAHFIGGQDQWKIDEDCKYFACDSPLPAIAARLMKATRLNLYEDSILVKEPGALEKTVFHQDLAYFHVDGLQVCTTWTPIDPVTRDTGALQFIRGSHLWKKSYRPNYFVTLMPLPDTEGEDVPDFHADRRDAEILCYDLNPGDLTVHHALTLHGADGNSSNTMRRRAMSVRYCGDDARYRLRRGAPRKPHHELVQTGDPLDHPDCPRVWQA
jgi:ectoine hydroxylase-related dioxygenase (phytanoyl-CoA dioxygenase family)